jgi:hypothetical protein
MRLRKICGGCPVRREWEETLNSALRTSTPRRRIAALILVKSDARPSRILRGPMVGRHFQLVKINAGQEAGPSGVWPSRVAQLDGFIRSGGDRIRSSELGQIPPRSNLPSGGDRLDGVEGLRHFLEAHIGDHCGREDVFAVDPAYFTGLIRKGDLQALVELICGPGEPCVA